MFEKAVESMLGRTITGSETMQQLAEKIRDNIDGLLVLAARGENPPFEDFSRFT